MQIYQKQRKLAFSFILLLLPTVLVGWVGLNQIGSLESRLKGILTNWSDLTITQAKKAFLDEFILFDRNYTQNLKKETIRTLRTKINNPSEKFFNNKIQFAIFLDKDYRPLRNFPKNIQANLPGITQTLTLLSLSKKYKKNKLLNSLLAIKVKLDGLIPIKMKGWMKESSKDPLIEGLKLYLLLPWSKNKAATLGKLLKTINIIVKKKKKLNRLEQVMLFTLTTSAIYEIERKLKQQKLFIDKRTPLAALGTSFVKTNITALLDNKYQMIPLAYLNESLILTESLVQKINELDLLEWVNGQKARIKSYWDLSKKFTEYFSTTIRPLLSEIKKVGLGTSISFPTIKTYGEVVLIKSLNLANKNKVFSCLFFKPEEITRNRLITLNKTLTRAGIPFKVEIENTQSIFTHNKDRKEKKWGAYKRTSTIPSPVFAGLKIVTYPKNLEIFLSDKRKTLLTKAVLLICLSLIAIAGGILLLNAINRERDLINQKEMFVARVSHELKTPLSLIQLYSETLASGKVKNLDQSRSFSKIIKKEAYSLNMLISNILNFSKKQECSKKYSLNPSTILSEVFLLFKHQLDREGFSFTINQTPKTTIFVNPNEFKQAIINLIANARKFSIEKKEISLYTQTDEKFFEISVSDRGMGIPEGDLSKIFTPFYRGTNSKQTRGVGLGLSIVKDFVNSCEGAILIQPRKSGGTRVTIKIPLA